MAQQIKVKYDSKYALKIRVDIGKQFSLITVEEAVELQKHLSAAIKKHDAQF